MGLKRREEKKQRLLFWNLCSDAAKFEQIGLAKSLNYQSFWWMELWVEKAEILQFSPVIKNWFGRYCIEETVCKEFATGKCLV